MEEELRGFYSLLRERRQNRSDLYPKCRKKLRPRIRESEIAALPQMYTGENVHPLLKAETVSSERRWSQSYWYKLSKAQLSSPLLL